MRKKKARFFAAEADGSCVCGLCPRNCRIASGWCGFCGVRCNRSGTLYATGYGYPAAINVEPMSRIFRAYGRDGMALGIGTFGCNLDCDFCCNTELARGRYEMSETMRYTPPEELVQLSRYYQCGALAFTYNEPAVFYEYMLDTARAAKAAGLKAVMTSNAYINAEPARELFAWIDAANFEIKSVRRDFYRRHCDGDFAAVGRTLELFHDSGRHMELTVPLAPGVNDAAAELEAVIEYRDARFGDGVPLTFSVDHSDGVPAIAVSNLQERLSRMMEDAAGRGIRNVHCIDS